MDSKSVRDGDSPSASAFRLPQLRSSRRGSLASLSSITQVDKHTMSQALDEIHSTASQSNALTIFNEYTSPPSSSSGTESKGLASELQGGLSGLYTRFRASVGNIKGGAVTGSEDPTPLDKSVGSDGKEKSPTLSARSGHEAFKKVNSGLTAASDSPKAGPPTKSLASSRPRDHHEIAAVQRFESRKDPSEAVAAPASLVPGSFSIARNPPPSLTQASKPTTVGPALAEINVGAFKGADRPSNGVRHVGRTDSQHHERSKMLSSVGIRDSETDTDACVLMTHTPRIINTTEPDSTRELSNRNNSPGHELDDLHDDKTPNNSEPHATPVVMQANQALQSDAIDEVAVDSSSDDEELSSQYPAEIVPIADDGKGEIVKSSNHKQKPPVTEQGGYQHLEIPLRKSSGLPVTMIPYNQIPQQPHTQSAAGHESVSTSSIQDTFVDGSTLTSNVPNARGEMSQSDALKSDASRDLRTMNVISQVKDKILKKEYWMKDENAKDCFYCGEVFSTFRRKHHCSKY